MFSLAGIGSAAIDRLTGVPSQWGGMSRANMGRFFFVRSVDSPAGDTHTFIEDYQQLDSAIVAPISDVNFEMTMNWQSPFENTGAENKAPALMAIIQSGQLGSSIAALQGAASVIGLQTDSSAATALKKSQEISRQLQGKTGMTKLNSTQVFSGAPPAKINMTIHFRAMQNPTSEVETPYQNLLKMAVPIELADDSYINNAINSATSGKSFLDTMFPSMAPPLIGFSYTGNTYMPMVIESISNPMDGQSSLSGQSIHKTVQVSMSTLAALDSKDLKKIFKRQGFF